MDKTRILLFAANPLRDLNIDEEIRSITERSGPDTPNMGRGNCR